MSLYYIVVDIVVMIVVEIVVSICLPFTILAAGKAGEALSPTSGLDRTAPTQHLEATMDSRDSGIQSYMRCSRCGVALWLWRHDCRRETPSFGHGGLMVAFGLRVAL